MAQDAASLLDTAARAARAAAAIVARAPSPAKDLALREAAAALRRDVPAILAANAEDLEAAPGLTAAFRDRLTLTPARIEAMAAGLEDVAALPDPVGRTLAEWTRPNGLVIRRVAQPLGVIGMIFESRPNVTADAAALCLKSGNAVILRGGSESIRSATAIHACLIEGLRAADLPEAAIQVAPTADRAFVGAMLRASGLIDLIVPRGGKGLVTRVMEEARVPVLAHAEGLCHTYIHAAADPAMARSILANAKMRRTGICGATETLLIDAAIAPALLPLLVADLRALGCDFRADDRARAIVADLPPASEQDFATEWLDAILSVKVVDGVEDALAHIRRYGSEHTEAIVTQDEAAAR
ncbi:MAG TPA: glutamate-5-semialdehyde dehydrogenase, partial [Roseomonas sp.]|nr:glutamate-5-semialdehyde dehydrogenase [Roseomonas sp.]